MLPSLPPDARAIVWPVIPVIPALVSSGQLITANWGNSLRQGIADLWTNLQALNLAAGGGGVPTTRQVIAGAGLSGGGALSADVTLTANVTSVFGRTGAVVLTAADLAAAGGVPSTRSVIAGAGLSGGGPLTADVTLNADVTSVFGRTGAGVLTAADISGTGFVASDDTSNQRVQAALGGTLVGSRRQLNFVASSGVTWNVVDNAGANRIDITANATGAGAATPMDIAVNGTLIGTRTELNLIAGTNTIITGVDNSRAGRLDVTFTAAGDDPIASVFGRTGAVVAANGDYTAAQVTNAVSTIGSYNDPAWLTGLAWSKISGAPAFVPNTIQVIAGTGLSGGGPLSGNVTLTALSLVASGVGHRAGYAPDPGATAGTTRFLREDATWAVPPAGGGGQNQTPWLSDIDGANHSLGSVAALGVGLSAPSTGGIVVGQTNALSPVFNARNYSSAPLGCFLQLTNDAAATFAIGVMGSGHIEPGISYLNSSLALILETASLERMRITAAGNVGIGNNGTPPLGPGHTYLTVGPQSPPSTGSFGILALCGNTNALGGGVGQVNFANYNLAASDKRIALINARTDNTLDSGLLSFVTFSAGLPRESMVITADGKVGVGTVGPQSILHVYRNQPGITALVIDNDTTAPGGQGIQFNYGATGGLGGIFHENSGGPWHM